MKFYTLIAALFLVACTPVADDTSEAPKSEPTKLSLLLLHQQSLLLRPIVQMLVLSNFVHNVWQKKTQMEPKHTLWLLLTIATVPMIVLKHVQTFVLTLQVKHLLVLSVKLV